ncbi:MAG TPA: zinc ribbon domain-containing protein [Gemmatimonadales bacterium]
MTTPALHICPACGASTSGNFCSGCGASLIPRPCSFCRAELSPQARFCHRCGRPATGAGGSNQDRSERVAWTLAGVLCVLLVGGIVYKVARSATQPAAPNMANAGAAGGDRPGAGPAPDISALTPQERFDRLFNRIMQAAERGDSAEVERFTPMALGAYQQLDARDADARYHAAVLHLQIGDFAPALALADSILAESPGHLFGYLIRGTVARLQNDSAARTRAERDFLAHYKAETAAKRVEYLEHQPVLDEFRSEAERPGGKAVRR